MKKLISTLFLSFIFCTSEAQNIEMVTVPQPPGYRFSSAQVIKITLKNMVYLMRMSFKDYYDFLKSNNYQKDDATDGYYQAYSSGNIYDVRKVEGVVNFLWTGSPTDVNDGIRDELSRYYTGERNERGQKRYAMSFENEKYLIYCDDNFHWLRMEKVYN